MADDYTVLNSGSGGDSMDEEGVTYVSSPTTRKRPRVVIGGSDAAQLAAVSSSDPASTDYGLVVRIVSYGQGDDGSVARGPMIQGYVNDAPPTVYVSNTVRPLSLTNDGRLRVASVDARVGVDFFNEGQISMWREGVDMTPGSPWGSA
jgi:hypothetical protein